MIAILAGNYNQYREFIHYNGLKESDYKYIDGTSPLVCYRFEKYKIIGTFYEDKKNWYDIIKEVELRTKPNPHTVE